MRGSNGRDDRGAGRRRNFSERFVRDITIFPSAAVVDYWRPDEYEDKARPPTPSAMNLQKKLLRWREAGLIDEATAGRIATYEQTSHRPVLLYALGGLGAFTLGLGIVSIIAANWSGIPRSTKLAVDLAVGAALAIALYRSASRRDQWLTDVLAGIDYVFVLASIGLIGQLYQLGSPHWHGLLAWSLATAPLMLLVRSPLLGALWLAGLATTHALLFVALFEWIDEYWNEWLELNLAVSLSFASLLCYIVVARTPWFRIDRPLVSATWTRVAWSALVVAALGLGFAFYGDIDDGHLSWGVLICAGLAARFRTSLPRLYPDVPPRARRGMELLLASIVLLLATATTFDRIAMPAIGAMSQVAVLAIAAWTVLVLGSVRMFNMLTAVISFRILVMYFEVFGSMLDTGLGLITGGLLTLLLAWVWKRKSPELAERLQMESVPGHAS
jgi:uncharacterized membrane protein